MSRYSINIYADSVVIEDVTLSNQVAFPRSGYKINYNSEEILLIDSDSNFVAQRFRKVIDIDSITDNRSGSPVVVGIPADLPSLFILLIDYFMAGAGSVSVDTGDIVVNTADIENLLQGVAGSVETPSISRNNNTTGTVAAGAFSVSITNTGVAACTVELVTINPGETVTWEAKVGNTLSAIDWVATGSELLILETR